MPGDKGYSWAEFQQLMSGLFGEQIDPPDVPRKYLLDALVEIRLFENQNNCPPESANVWRSKLTNWLKKMTELRTIRKSSKGKHYNMLIIY